MNAEVIPLLPKKDEDKLAVNSESLKIVIHLGSRPIIVLKASDRKLSK